MSQVLPTATYRDFSSQDEWQGSDTSSRHSQSFDENETPGLAQGSPNTESSERSGSPISKCDAQSSAEEIFFDAFSMPGRDLMEQGESSDSSRGRFNIADFLPLTRTNVEYTDWGDYPPPAELLEVPAFTSIEIESIIDDSIERLQDRLTHDSQLQQQEEQREEEVPEPYEGKGKEPEIIEREAPDQQHTRSSKPRPITQSPNTMSTSGYLSAMEGNWGKPARTVQKTSRRHRVSSSQDSGYESASPENELEKAKLKGFKLTSLFKRIKRKSSLTGSSSWQSQSTITIDEEKECVSCLDDFDSKLMVPLVCHSYCKQCFEELIKTAINSETQWPPKCCLNEISTETLLPHLSLKTKKAYNDMHAERSVPAGDRIYCSKPNCAAFIPLSHITLNISCAICAMCRSKTCTTCRGPHHQSGDCPSDLDLQATMRLADDEGWKRCYSCSALVEHNQGCIHMTCKCKAEFCYICGLRWRTCGCADAQLDVVLEAARERRAEAAERERAAVARTHAEEEEARLLEEVRMMEEEELRSMLEEIEEFEAREAERLIAEAEAVRLAEVEEQQRKIDKRVIEVSKHYDDLRHELEVLHAFQKIALFDRNDGEMRTIKGNNQKRENLRISHQGELILAELEAQAKIADSESKYDSEFQTRRNIERHIEEGYAAQLREYWSQQPFENGEARVAEAMHSLRLVNENASKVWLEQRKTLHQVVVDNANQEVVAIRLRHRRETATVLGDGRGAWLGDENEGTRRAWADGRWIEEVARVREEMLAAMEVAELARIAQ